MHDVFFGQVHNCQMNGRFECLNYVLYFAKDKIFDWGNDKLAPSHQISIKFSSYSPTIRKMEIQRNLKRVILPSKASRFHFKLVSSFDMENSKENCMEICILQCILIANVMNLHSKGFFCFKYSTRMKNMVQKWKRHVLYYGKRG